MHGTLRTHIIIFADVGDCSALGDSPGEQVRFGLAQEHWPAEYFRQLGQRSVQLLQYSTGTEVVL